MIHLETNAVGMTLVEFDLNEPVALKEGDIVGIFQPRSGSGELILQFQSGSAPASYVRLINSPSETFSTRGAITNHDYPLISAHYQG